MATAVTEVPWPEVDETIRIAESMFAPSDFACWVNSMTISPTSVVC